MYVSILQLSAPFFWQVISQGKVSNRTRCFYKLSEQHTIWYKNFATKKVMPCLRYLYKDKDTRWIRFVFSDKLCYLVRQFNMYVHQIYYIISSWSSPDQTTPTTKHIKITFYVMYLFIWVINNKKRLAISWSCF